MPKVQVAGYSYTRMHPAYVALHEMTWHGAWLHGVHRTRRDDNSFSLHQAWVTTKRRCKYTTLVDI